MIDKQFNDKAYIMTSYGHKKWRQILSVSITIIMVMTVSGCIFNKKNEQKALPSEPASKIYSDGVRLLQTGQASSARKKFEELEKVYPYSRFAGNAMLLTAYSRFRGGDYEETISTSERYLILFPGTKKSAYAQYLIGQSYFKMIGDITRDQKNAYATIDAFNALINNYPNSIYIEDAKYKIIIAKDQIAGHEMEIGRYYLGNRDYIAAINRFKRVIDEYDTTRHIEEALARTTEAYLALGIVSEARKALSVLGLNYPKSRWYKAAYKLIAERRVPAKK